MQEILRNLQYVHQIQQNQSQYMVT